LIPGGGNRCGSAPKVQAISDSQPTVCREYSGRGVRLAAFLHPVPRLSMSGAIPLVTIRFHGAHSDNILSPRQLPVCWQHSVQTTRDTHCVVSEMEVPRFRNAEHMTCVSNTVMNFNIIQSMNHAHVHADCMKL